MKRKSNLFEGWNITFVAVLGMAFMVGVILASYGADEAGLRVLIRATARSSVSLFLLAFAASSLVRVRPNSVTKWLLRNRRYIGVSMALSHFLHLGAILAVRNDSPGSIELGLATVVLGGLAYVFLGLLALTSSDAAVALLGQKQWKWLHWIGMYYVWLAFIQAYAKRAPSSLGYAVLTGLLAGALLLRLGLGMKEKRCRRERQPLGQQSTNELAKV